MIFEHEDFRFGLLWPCLGPSAHLKGFIIEVYLAEIESELTINYRYHESGYQSQFFDKNIPWKFMIMKSFDELGAHFEVSIM